MSQSRASVVPGVPPLIELRSVRKRFQQGGGEDIVALRDVSLSVRPGEFVVIVGHNGSGKSTLLDVVSGLLPLDSGEIRFAPSYQRNNQVRVARVRQNPGDGTFASLTVLENFHLFHMQGLPSPFRFCVPPATEQAIVVRLEKYGISAKRNQRVSELSQGQRQLLALELAMSRRPQMLLLDEHTASLDRENASICMGATVQLASEFGTTVLMITHNMADALRYGDTLVVMRDGRIVHRLDGIRKSVLSAEDLMRHCGFMS